MKESIFALLFFITSAVNSFAQWSVPEYDTSKKVEYYLTQKFSKAEWSGSNFASPDDLKWFNDARFGMFIHFGLSTYIGRDLSWGVCYTRKSPDFGHGIVPDSVWEKFPQYFVLDKFDAEEWVKTARKAGMKYIVVVAKHHDGFHMWDTEFSDFKITNTPFGRDYLKEIADACHSSGMKLGIYYSQRDWYHPDYSPVDTSMTEFIKDPPYFRPKPCFEKVKPGVHHPKYIEYQFKVVRELCTKYGKIDIFWFDAAWWGGMFTAEMWDSEKLTRMVRELQPGIIINNRASIPGDFDTPEQIVGMYQVRSWESCLSLCDSWAWSDTPVKSAEQLIRTLTNTACGNGNLLLSWGPKWDGAFDPLQIDRLEEIGRWLEKFSTAIYDTRGGPWYPGDWGGSTYRNKKVYVHITGKVGNELSLPALPNKITSAKCLTGGKVKFLQDSNSVYLNLEKASDNWYTRIIELTFETEITGMVDPVSKY